MKLKKYLFLLFILNYSCVDKEKSISDDSSSQISKDEDFPVVSINYAEFKTGIDLILDEGPSFIASITFKNNTSNNISKFTIDYYVKAFYDKKQVKI